MTQKIVCLGGPCDAASETIKAGGSRASLKDYFHYSIPLVTLAAGTPGVTQVLQIPFYPDSYFVVTKMFAQSTGIFTARIRNDSNGQTIHTPSVLVNNVNLFGTAQLPNKLIDPLVIAPNATLSVELADMSGAPNTVQIVLCGYRHFDFQNPPAIKKADRPTDWFQVVVEKVLTASEGPTQVYAKIDVDADFLVRKLVASSTGAFSTKLADTSTGDFWSDQPQHNANLFGTAQYPLILPKPKLIKAGNTITFELIELSVASNTLQLVLEGAKVRK